MLAGEVPMINGIVNDCLNDPVVAMLCVWFPLLTRCLLVLVYIGLKESHSSCDWLHLKLMELS